MAQKPDFYEVLGVAKTATKAEIKTAYQRIVMRNHPDMRKKKGIVTPEQIAEAETIFQLATEADAVLSDDSKRATYDKYGHKGIENLAAGKNAGSGQTYADVAGPTQKRTYSDEDTMSFFDRKRDEQRKETSGTADDGLTSEQRRERARQERMARRGKGADTTPEHFNGASAANVFHDVAEKVSNATEALKGGNVAVPLDVLEQFRDNLADFAKEIDKAIARAKPGNGPKR